MQIKFILLILFLVSNVYAASTSKYQLNINGGIEQLKAGQTRTAAAKWARFAISTRPRTFRAVGAFEALYATDFMQGNFALGFHIYPFAAISRTPILPFIAAEGSLGLGKLNEELRYDIGYDVMVGVDLNLFKKSGFQLMVKQHNAKEDSLVLMLGMYFQG